MNAFMLAGFKTATSKRKKLKSSTGKINTVTNTTTVYVVQLDQLWVFCPPEEKEKPSQISGSPSGKS